MSAEKVALPDLEPELPSKPGLAAYEELLTLQEQREEMRDDLDDLNQEIATLGVERDALAQRIADLPARAQALRDRILDRLTEIVRGFTS